MTKTHVMKLTYQNWHQCTQWHAKFGSNHTVISWLISQYTHTPNPLLSAPICLSSTKHFNAGKTLQFLWNKNSVNSFSAE